MPVASHTATGLLFTALGLMMAEDKEHYPSSVCLHDGKKTSLSLKYLACFVSTKKLDSCIYLTGLTQLSWPNRQHMYSQTGKSFTCSYGMCTAIKQTHKCTYLHKDTHIHTYTLLLHIQHVTGVKLS